MLGLDGSGKTTCLYKLKLNEFVNNAIPTLGFNVEETHNMRICDIGGQKRIREHWRHYFDETSCLIWMIDPYDTEERIEESLSCLYHNLCKYSL